MLASIQLGPGRTNVHGKALANKSLSLMLAAMQKGTNILTLNPNPKP